MMEFRELSPRKCSIITFLLFFIFQQKNVLCHRHVENFKISSLGLDLDKSTFSLSDLNVNKLLERHRRDTSGSTNDPVCDKQETTFLSEIYNSKTNVNGTKIENRWVFKNESNLNLALAWAGKDDDGVLLAVTTEDSGITASAQLWRSTDFGRNWEENNKDIEKAVIRKGDGVVRNPHNSKKVYLLTYSNIMYVTEDGGASWNKRIAAAEGDSPGQLVFHSSPEHEDYILTVTSKTNLYVTIDNWKDWSQIRQGVHSNIDTALWGSVESGYPKSVYCMIGKPRVKVQDFMNALLGNKYQKEYVLCRHEAVGTGMSQILQRVASFGIQGKFLYASIFKDENAEQNAKRFMQISTDGGTSWADAALPTLTGDRFYSVLDMSEELIFMHVDNPGDTGHGTLFTSAAEGLVYSESLERHLYPNYGHGVTDFYKVESIRGVYLASQIDSDDSIHSMITFNRGATWQKISAPENSVCKSNVQGCYLQIHNKYSVARGIKAKLPLSIPDAKGLVLVHGHVADALQTTSPDVFLTNNGGYTWRKVLDGPHSYQIANSGGLIVAMSLSTNTPNIVKFSTDEGRCWHEYEFTDEDINLTGLLTEPGGKSMTCSIWGYHKVTHKWTVFVIDFKDVITGECKSGDYVEWKAHESLRKNENAGVEGCLLGEKQSFKKLKPDSWCHNTYFYKPIKDSKQCTCTREDYECEFAFKRPAGSDLCILDPNFRSGELDVCEKGEIIKLITNGYRKIPGDVCVGGFQPKDEHVDMKAKCNAEIKEEVFKDEGKVDTQAQGMDHSKNSQDKESDPSKNTVNSGAHSTIVTVIVVIVLISVVTIASFFLYKVYLLRKHKVVYCYSLLAQNQGENQDFDANLEGVLTNNASLYNDDSDEEQDTTKSNGNPFENNYRSTGSSGVNVTNNKPPVKSYHDDSDDDLLN